MDCGEDYGDDKMKKPKPPLARIREEFIFEFCSKCGSTLKRNFNFFPFIRFGKILGCLQPECENYYGK